MSDAPPNLLRRIMIVEDHKDVAETMAILLRLAGHRVETAIDGATALVVAGSLLPDVVFLDLGLPGMSGYEVARRLRQMPFGHHLILIALTGYGLDTDIVHTQAAGFDQHLVKPVDIDCIMKTLSSLPAPKSDGTPNGKVPDGLSEIYAPALDAERP